MVADDAEIVDQGMYIFGTEVILENWFEHLVDLEVIRKRSDIHSATTDVRIEFDTALQKRDPYCVFSSVPLGFCEGLHIIPFARGTDWLDILISDRLLDADCATQPTNINDVQNGLLMSRNFYGLFDIRHLVVMKSPNKVLLMKDIPDAPARIINKKCSFPQNVRFTAQWLVSDPKLKRGLVNNTDAAFKTWSRQIVGSWKALISTAAGPVGSFLAQIAKRAGLKVIGSTGSDDKVAFLKSIGVDVAFNYKTEDMRSVLQREGPIQFYFDHVGGDTLDAALENMAPEGKVIVCGQIASYNGAPVPVKNFPLILTKRLTVIGHMVWVYESKYADEFYRVIPREIAEGKIKIVEHEYQGLDEAGQALLDVQKGDNKGKAVVILSKA